MLHPAVFLDRDGVINHNHGYVHKIGDFDFIEGIFDVARHAYQQKYKLIVITNQAGIARGYYTEEQFQKLTDCVTLPSESGSHYEMHNLVYGRCYGKDKPGAVHAGI